MRASDLFEAQIANADTVIEYCNRHATAVVDPLRSAWLSKSARRYISNSGNEFMIRYNAKDYRDGYFEKSFINGLVSP